MTYQSSSYQGSGYQSGSTAANLTDAVVDTMVRWPMRMTGATVDFMIRGMQSMTGTGPESTSRSGATINGRSSYDSTTVSQTTRPSSSGPTWTSWMTGTSDQDLSGDDLKYVIWSIVFTKPGYECVVEPQHDEIVNYNADGSTFAAVKIAKFLDKARHGHAPKPEAWADKNYPGESKAKASGRKNESTTVIASGTPGTPIASSSASQSEEKGWRIPAEDHKYLTFLYRVDRRLPRQEEVTRVERVTVERDTRVA